MVTQLDKAMRYKPEDRGFNSHWGQYFTNLIPPTTQRPWGQLSL